MLQTSCSPVQMTNKLLNQLLGYKPGELDGLNVNSIMPPPFSHQHNGYLRAFKAGAPSPMLGATSKVLALRKDKSVVPVSIRVTKMNQGSDGLTFIGVMHPYTDDDTGERSLILNFSIKTRVI